MKAKTALTLGKSYRQDQALEWGFLTEPEVSHLARRRERSRQEKGGTERSPAGSRRIRRIQTGRRRDSRRDRDNAELGWCAQRRTDGPADRSRSEHDPVRTAALSHLDDVPQSQGARRGRISRHRRRVAPGPDGHRRGPVTGTRHASRPTSSPARSLPTPAVITSSGSSSSMTAKSGPRSSSRRSPRDASASFSASIGPSMPWSRRPSWRHAQTGCPLTRCWPTFASSRLSSTRPEARASARPSPSCTGTCARPRSGADLESDPSRSRRNDKTIAVMHIRTPSRLHFGLLGWGTQAGRQFGGIGLMIDAPGIELTVEPASSWRIEGPHAPRVAQLVDQPTYDDARSRNDVAARPYSRRSASRPNTSAWASERSFAWPSPARSSGSPA